VYSAPPPHANGDMDGRAMACEDGVKTSRSGPTQ